MKHYLHTITIILFIALVGCNEAPKQIYERYSEFPETVSLTAEQMYLDSAFFRYPWRIAVKGDIAIIEDLHNPDYYLHAYSLPEWKRITSFAPRGEGPEELIICETFQFTSPDSIWALDPNKMRIYRYRLDTEKEEAILAEIIPVNPQILRPLDLVVLEEGGFIVPDYHGEHRYHLLNRLGNPVRSEGFIPKEGPEKISVALAQGWRPFFDYNEKKGLLAVATQLGEVIEIYSLTDTTHIVRYGPHGEPQFVESEGNGYPAGIMGFVDIQITDNYIYAIFEGTYFQEKMELFFEGKEPPSGGNRVYVFDLEGNPVRTYQLDHYIYSLYVQEEEGLFYALDLNQDDPVVKYRF